MHYLQKAILDKLRYEQPLTYTALMPDGIESSHFRYHLKQLMTDGLVNKSETGGYTLSDKGKQEVDYLSNNRTTVVRTPKVITYTLITYGEELLLYKKPKEPYRNLWGLIGGKVHFGEDMQQAAKREVHEKTGLSIESPQFCGVADIIIYTDDKPLSHVIAYVHRAEVYELSESLPSSLEAFDPSVLGDLNLIPDLLPILEEINKASDPFVKQLHAKYSSA